MSLLCSLANRYANVSAKASLFYSEFFLLVKAACKSSPSNCKKVEILSAFLLFPANNALNRAMNNVIHFRTPPPPNLPLSMLRLAWLNAIVTFVQH